MNFLKGKSVKAPALLHVPSLSEIYVHFLIHYPAREPIYKGIWFFLYKISHHIRYLNI